MTWLRTQSTKDLRRFGIVQSHTMLIHALTFDSGVPGGQLFSGLYTADTPKLLLFTACEEDSLPLNKCRQAREAQTHGSKEKKKNTKAKKPIKQYNTAGTE